jgi:hypothetical protein
MLGRALFSKASRTVGGKGYTGLEHLLFHVKVIGELQLLLLSAKKQRRKKEGDFTECYLTVNEGEKCLPHSGYPTPHRTH